VSIALGKPEYGEEVYATRGADDSLCPNTPVSPYILDSIASRCRKKSEKNQVTILVVYI